MTGVQTCALPISEAIWTLVNQEQIFECVIGSGLPYSIENWLELCFSINDMDWRDHFAVKEKFTPDYRILVSDPKTIKSLGWKPKIDLNQLGKMMVG